MIGAGIAGLTLSAALKHQNLEVKIFEARTQAEGGAALAMAPNAMWVFRQLGLADPITAAGTRIDRYLFVNRQGRVLKSVNLSDISAGWKESAWAVPRAHILGVLTDALPSEWITNGLDVTNVAMDQGSFTIHLGSPQSPETAPIVVGADGAGSVVRRSLWPSLAPARYQGFFAIRGVVPHRLPPDWGHTVFQVWGGAGEFGFSPLGPDSVYWFGTIPWPTVDSPPDGEDFSHHFRGWFDPVQALLHETDPAALLIHPIYDRLAPFSELRSGAATLIGDAAHLMTPNTGQGACQGILDAWVLARELASRQSPLEALSQYRRLRLPRALAVARRSHQLGRIIHAPIPEWFKTSLLSAMPSSIIGSAMKKVVGSPDQL